MIYMINIWSKAAGLGGTAPIWRGTGREEWLRQIVLAIKTRGIKPTRCRVAEPEDIFDVNAQIRKYTQQVAARINAGLSVEEIISRHITSDYVTEINWEYVNAVLQWLR